MASLLLDHAGNVGVQVIDDEYSILMETLTELRKALLKNTDTVHIRALLRLAADLMRQHGENEDRLLETQGFPNLAAHHAEYQRLLGRLEQFNVRFEQRQSAAVYELVEYLRKWFTTHTGIAGQKYGPWLQQCGVE